MVYASSKDALRRTLVGVGADIQGTDLSEIAYESGASNVPACGVLLAYIRLYPIQFWTR